MSTIQFENGTKVEFDGTPTAADVEEVSARVGGSKAPQQEGFSLGKTLMNVPGSAANLVGGVVNAVANPIDTVTNIGKIGMGGIEKLAGHDNGNIENFDAFTNFYKERYGGMDKFLKTLQEDPVGVASDVALAFTGAGAGLKGAATAGNLSKIGSVSNTARTLGKIGNAIDPLSAVVKGSGRVLNLGAKGMSEMAGLSTGTGGGAVRQTVNSVREGGQKSQDLYDAMRGKTSPEDIVLDAKNSLDEMISNRSTSYKESLQGLKDVKVSLNIQPIVDKFYKGLEDFHITPKKGGILDFSDSTIRFNTPQQTIVQKIFDEMKGYGLKKGDRTILSVDRLRQAFDDLYSDSSRVRSFVQGMKDTTRTVGQQVPGYADMLKNYSESTSLIKEISKDLSLGTKASLDTGFRKLSTALKTNNEIRKAMIDELDKISGGSLPSKIAGQQMSEFLPRGLMRQLGGVGVGAGALSGVALIPLLKAAIITSPRLVGEVLGGIGYTQRQIDKLTAIIKNYVPEGTMGAASKGLQAAEQVNESQRKLEIK